MWPFRRSKSSSRRSVLRRAETLASRGRAEEAAELLEAYCDGHPDDFAGLVNLGAAYYATGKYTPAIETFKRALAINPGSATLWLNIGACRNALGHIDKAIEALLKALEIDPKHRDVHYNLAVAQQKKGRPLAAMAELELELAVNPTHKQARQMAAHLKAALLPNPNDGPGRGG